MEAQEAMSALPPWRKEIVYMDGRRRHFNLMTDEEVETERASTMRRFNPDTFGWVSLFDGPDVHVDYNGYQMLCIYTRGGTGDA